MPPVAYDPNNPTQQSFLKALALGETGQNPSLLEGFGNTDLSGMGVDQYGFPQWGGSATSAGPTHAAGPFQFEPGTWDSVAAQYGLNFGNAQDQEAGAWYTAQQADPNLYSQLQSGDYADVQSSLKSIWPTVTGITGHPLSLSLANGLGAILPGGGGSSGAAGGAAGATASASENQSLGFLGGIQDVEQFFLRFGLIIIGGVVVIVALWQLLADHSAIPGPAKAAGELAALA